MTLSSFLSPSNGYEKAPINERGDHVHYHNSWSIKTLFNHKPDLDKETYGQLRITCIKIRKGGGSKGGQVSQSAISALTLLAFLFFLNILQTCLKDQLQGQSPLVIMMTTQTTTTTTETQRHKRSSKDMEKEDGNRQKGDTHEERNKSSKQIDFRSQVTNQITIRKEDYFEKKILKKSANNRSQQIFTSFGVPENSYSPWLQSVICCKILSCQKPLEEGADHQYSSYFRRFINYLCYTTNEAKQNSCTRCLKSHQD